MPKGSVFITLVESLGAGLASSASYRVGDQIGTHGYRGTVVEVTTRNTVVSTRDGRKVDLPNVNVSAQPIVIFSAFEQRRSEVELSIDYETDIESVSRLLVDAMLQVEGARSDPAPQVLPKGFGALTYDVDVRWWHDSDIGAERRTRAAVITAIKSTLDTNGITMPPPAMIVRDDGGDQISRGTGQ